VYWTNWSLKLLDGFISGFISDFISYGFILSRNFLLIKVLLAFLFIVQKLKLVITDNLKQSST
jgi:hypothetical protein